MADHTEQQQEEQIHTPSPQPLPETSPATTTMADTEAQAPQPQSETKPKAPHNISFSIWPPTQRTRDAVISRLIDTLSSPSVLSKRYGTVPQEEASDLAKRIEEEAFVAAGGTVSGDDDGIEILQVYSKEISKRMLDTVKSRSAPAASTPAPAEEEKKAVPEEAEAAAAVEEESSDAGVKKEE